MAERPVALTAALSRFVVMTVHGAEINEPTTVRPHRQAPASTFVPVWRPA
jgi:hypothetical protein